MSIILNHVSYTYEKDTSLKVDALKDINLKIDDGEFIGLIGHTGSGKSTLVQLLNALLVPTEGNIFYDGADIHDPEYDRKKLRSNVGLVFQYPEHQLFDVDVFSDVCFGPKNMGLSKKEAELSAYAALEKVGISHDYFYQSPFDLSGGEKRKVAIAGVLAMKPRVLVLDEPTAGLDPKGRTELLNMLRDLHEELKITIILVSHSMDDVAEYAKRIVVVNKGRIIMDGAPKEVFAHYDELRRAGLDVPEVLNVLKGLRDRGLNVDLSAVTIEEACQSIIKAVNGRK